MFLGQILSTRATSPGNTCTHLVTQLRPNLPYLLVQLRNLPLQMSRTFPQAKQHPHCRRKVLVILIADPFDLVFLFLHKRIETL